jgi:hypothetical protein
MGLRNREKELAVSLARLRALLSYDPDTGKLTWLRPPRRGVGIHSEVGCIANHGYRTVTIDGEAFLAANLIWFLVRGEWPLASLDHVNRDRSDDRLSNLRPATQTENNFNQKVRADNVLGVTGVSYSQTRKQYVAQLHVNGRAVLHRRFRTESEAAMARRNAELIHCGKFMPQEHEAAA